MKSRLYSMLLLLICTITAQAQEYHVETPGTLQEVIGSGAEELTRIRVTGTLNDRDIAFLHYLCWPIAPKPTDMKDESYLKIAMQKEDTRVCQNVHILFFMHKAPTFSSQGFAIS